MRATLTRTNDHYWYREGGSNSWGLGFEVEHHADLVDTGTDTEVEGSGFIINLLLGPWVLSLSTEQAFRNVYGSSVEYMGRFEVMP